jgi:hypothetical protein
MGTRKKKDRVRAQRQARRKRGPSRPDARESGPASCEGPRITVTSPEEFDAWIERSTKAAENRDKRLHEFIDTPLGWVLLAANDNRRPAHLLTPVELFSEMRTDPHDANDYSAVSRAWLSDDNLDPAAFVACDCAQLGLGELWNTYAYYEQFYMDVWSLLNAESSRDEMLVRPPQDVATIKQALLSAYEAFQNAHQEQCKLDRRYLYAFDTIRIAEDARVEELLKAATEEDELFNYGESDFRGSTLWFTPSGGPANHTATAAGYRAAVQVLRQNGIGCEQWSYWD